MIFARLLVGLALIAIAALGPRFGLQSRSRTSSPAPGTAPSTAQPNAQPRDDRRATVLVLRILAALLGLWLVFFSAVQLLHGHGRLSPAATQQSLSTPSTPWQMPGAPCPCVGTWVQDRSASPTAATNGSSLRATRT